MIIATRKPGILLALLFIGLCLFWAIPLAGAHGNSGSSNSGDSDTPDPDDGDDHDSSDDGDHSESDDDDGDDNSGSGSDDEPDDNGSDNDSDNDSDSDSDNSGSSNSPDDDDGDNDDSEDRGGSNSGSRHSETGASGEDRAGRHSNRGSESGKRNSPHVSRLEANFEIHENDRGERVRVGEVVLVSARADVAPRLAAKGLAIIETFKLPAMGLNGFRISVPAKSGEEKVLQQLRQIDPEGIASFNHVYVPARGGATVATSSAVRVTSTAPLVRAKIGLVDAGVNSKHPMLREVSVDSRDFGFANSPDDEHGTAVASRIAEVAPGANLMVASVFSLMKDGQEIASVDAIARGLDWLSRSNVPVINLSLAGPANPILQAVTAKLIAKGHVLVAAVGNEGPYAAPQYPAAYNGVVGVTAVDAQNRIYIYANQGAYVDFAAAGVNTLVAAKEGERETVSGTSYAAPVIAVALAKRLHAPDRERAKRAELELAKIAKDVGEPGRDPVYGYGIVELANDRP